MELMIGLQSYVRCFVWSEEPVGNGCVSSEAHVLKIKIRGSEQNNVVSTIRNQALTRRLCVL